MIFSQLNEYKRAMKNSSFHARFIISILFFEKIGFLPLLFKVMRKLINQCIYHCEIHPDSFFSAKAILTLRLPHPFLIIIHRSARIGNDVTLFHNVTIGAREHRHSGFPIVYDGAYISTGVTILGDVSIGSNAVIGAGSIVLKNVSEDGFAVGVYK
ncbi:hypothetical protein LHL03_06915 [Pectobacterium carotovorum]|uniref:hypothetical protein n=1 Tax=Pectobacterium carotovorum TaxID=554 RepID=UPI001CFAAA01|nr:hypothetical protein [Pectobacterium carotovorum]UCZ80856.1 hypothetical protein LHL03_06915 [Pectobacterium carotovorum]